MKTVVFIFFLLLTRTTGIAQPRSYHYDSLNRSYNYLINEPFAELELEDTSGKLIKTSSLTGKTIYVDFWFTTCPPCIKEMPYAKSLQEYFANDTNIVFLSICIENIQTKTAWKQIIKDKALPGLHLFYARNRPQKVNLLRKYKITFPTYLLVNKEMRVIGYNAPRPSEKGLVHWSIMKAAEGKSLADSYKDVLKHTKQYGDFLTTLNTNINLKF
jgi:thiol-disulfide isomerase/thioredoxin